MRLRERLANLEARAPVPSCILPLADAVAAYVALLERPARPDPSWDGITTREAERRYFEAIHA